MLFVCACLCVSCCGWFPDISLCISTWRETSVCTVGLHWLEERWYMSICATVHMKATWLSTVLWFMPLITTTQKSSQQQQSSTEGWQQWDTCRSGDEKMFSYVTFFFFPFFPSIIFLDDFFRGVFCLFVLVCFFFILPKVINEAKCGVAFL